MADFESKDLSLSEPAGGGDDYEGSIAHRNRGDELPQRGGVEGLDRLANHRRKLDLLARAGADQTVAHRGAENRGQS